VLLDFSIPWGIIHRTDDSLSDEAADYAEAELSAVLGRMTGVAPARAEASRESRFLVLDSGSPSRRPGGPKRQPRFSWRAAADRVELYGEDGPALVRAVYDFLGALGARWVSPGSAGERLPRGARLELASSAGASSDGPAAVLALAHRVFLEDWEAELAWAARVGYSSVAILLTADPLALGAAPTSLYDRVRPELTAFARRAGLAVELGGLLEARSGAEEPGDVGERAAALALAYPEASVFHAWPDDLPGGGWRSAPPMRPPSPPAESLAVAAAMARAVAAARPGAALSFRAGPGDGALAVIAGRASGGPVDGLPDCLELLWDPRGRPRGRALRDADGASADPSIEAFARAARDWKAAGGGRVSVLERWEDGLLYKCAVPPMTRAMAGDLAAYRGAGADAVGVLRAGPRPAFAPRPNAYLAPALARGYSAERASSGGAASGAASDGAASGAAARSEAALADWAFAAYGKAGARMLEYWRELEEAWGLGLDVDAGETGLRDSGPGAGAALAPPADWGDPWRAGLPRLAERRGRCEELFDRLRAAERELEEAGSAARGDGAAELAVRAEADEYAVSGSVLELECARLAVYHELAAGDSAAAADVSNLALSASGAVKAALGRVGDRRARAEGRLLIRAFYDLGLRSIRRANARSSLRRKVDAFAQAVLVALAAARVRRH
jgi:hypothetical protein